MILFLLLFSLAWAQSPDFIPPQVIVDIGLGQVQVRTQGVSIRGDLLDQLTARILVAEEFRDLVTGDPVTSLTLEGSQLQKSLRELKLAEDEFVEEVAGMLREKRGGAFSFGHGYESWYEKFIAGPQSWSDLYEVRESLWVPWIGFFILWVVMALQNAVLSALSPFYVERVQWFLRDFKAGSLGLGLMATMALPLLTLLLVVSVVGVMVLPLVAGLYVVWLLIGFMQVSVWLGGHIPTAQRWPPSLRLGVGLLFIVAMSQVPAVGGFLFAYFLLLGFGAACRAMTSWVRMGA